VRRWFEYTHNNKAWQSYQVSVQRRQAFNTLLRDTRQQLADLYRQPLDPSTMEQRKRSIFVTLKANYVKLKQGWQNDDRYDHWMAQDLNNAHLALVGTYYDQVPGFQAMLNQANGNIAVFYELVEALSAKPVTVGGTRVSGIVR
jgi:predicted aminopeptidase